MKFTFEILCVELAKRMDAEIKCAGDSYGIVESPMLFEPGAAILSKYCYVSECFPPVPHEAKSETIFIVCGAVAKESLREDGFGVIFFPNPQPVTRVMNAVLETFEKYWRWEAELLTALHESESLDGILRPGVRIFDNPLYLIDADYNTVAMAAPASQRNYERSMEPGDAVWIIRGKDDLVRAKNVHVPYLRHLPDDFPRMFINLSEGKRFLGVLSIQASHRPFRGGDEHLLIYLSDIIKKAMSRLGATDNKHRNLFKNMLSGILAGGGVSVEDFAHVLTSVGIDGEERFRCLAIGIPRPSGEEFTRYFLQHLGLRLPAVSIPSDEEFAAMILRVSVAEQQGINVNTVLESELKSFGLRSGMSDEYGDLLLTRHYFAQARYALERGGPAEDGDCCVPVFSDHCLSYILDRCCGDLRPSMLWTEGFRRLAEHDMGKSRVNYIETLRAYLHNNLNDSRTAAALYITRNSFLSRLERIRALIGDDLTNPKVRFRYELSLLLYERWDKK
jgi:hypothetical protein